jgi:polyisoprenoid-binding protein YceI
MKTRKNILALTLSVAAVISLLFTQCKKDTETITEYVTNTVYVDPNDTGIFVPGTAVIDLVNDADTTYGKWAFEKSHSNVNWESEYYNMSVTMLTGRFNNFNFNPMLIFNENDLANSSVHFWVQMSTYNTGEPGRDGLGKCGLNYLGITYTDSNKVAVNPISDTAWFHMTSITVDAHEGYIMNGTMTFNRYRPLDGHADNEPITKPVQAHLSFNGQQYFPPTGTATVGKLRAGFTSKFSFNRSDFVDIYSTVPYWPTPKASEAITNATTAANNKTYGVWSISTADEMDITVNCVFVKNYVQ